MFRMKRILIFGGILLIVISFLGFVKNYKKKDVLLKGEEVSVAIVSYQPYSGKIKGSFKFQYNGKRYSKDLKGEFNQEVKNNRTIKLITNSDNSIFIHPDENIEREMISIAILFLLGIIIIYKGVK